MTSKAFRSFDPEDDEELVKSDKRFYIKPFGQEVSFYLSGFISEPQDYTDWFHVMRNSGPNDVIHIYINSRGGNAATAIQFSQCMDECPATLMVHVDGDCASAATLIFLKADRISICDHASFMFHNYRGMIAGKGGEMKDTIMFEQKWSENLLRDAYKDFLTKEEITAILDNKDLYMTKEEVLTRLEKKAKVNRKKTSLE